MNKTAWTIFALLIAEFALFPVAQGQEDTPGALYLTNTQVAYIPDASDVCDEVQYAFTATPPASDEDQKAYTSRTYGPAVCFGDHRYNFTQPSTLTGDAEFQFWFACDSDAFGPAASGVRSNVRVRFYKNDEADFFGSTSMANPEMLCSGDPIEASGTVALTETPFAKGDMLRVEFTLFYGPADESMYYVVNSTGHPSQVRALGLPQGSQALPVETFELEAARANSTSTPGSYASFDLSLRNAGNESANFTLATEGLPETFTPEFSQQNGTLNASQSADVILNVTVDANATAGPYPFAVNVSGLGGGSSLIHLTVEVVDRDETMGANLTTPTPTTRSPTRFPGRGGDDAGSDNGTGNGTEAAVNATSEGDVPGPGWALAAGAVGAAGVIAARRRRRA